MFQELSMVPGSSQRHDHILAITIQMMRPVQRFAEFFNLFSPWKPSQMGLPMTLLDSAKQEDSKTSLKWLNLKTFWVSSIFWAVREKECQVTTFENLSGGGVVGWWWRNHQRVCLYIQAKPLYYCLLPTWSYSLISIRNTVLSQLSFLHHGLNLYQDHHLLRKESLGQRSICPWSLWLYCQAWPRFFKV